MAKASWLKKDYREVRHPSGKTTRVAGDEKLCSTCELVKPSTKFHKNKYSEDGLHKYCKECRKAYYQDDKEAYIKRAKAWSKQKRKDDPEYFEKINEAAREKRRAYREKHPLKRKKKKGSEYHYDW